MIVLLLLLNVVVLMAYLLSDHHTSDTAFDTKEQHRIPVSKLGHCWWQCVGVTWKMKVGGSWGTQRPRSSGGRPGHCPGLRPSQRRCQSWGVLKPERNVGCERRGSRSRNNIFRDLHRESFFPGHSLFFLNYSPTLVLGYTPSPCLYPRFLSFLPSFLKH